MNATTRTHPRLARSARVPRAEWNGVEWLCDAVVVRLLAVILLFATGCSLERNGIVDPNGGFDAGRVDSGMNVEDDAGRFDGGPAFDAGNDSGRDACIQTGDPTDDCDMEDDDCDGMVDEDCDCEVGTTRSCGDCDDGDQECMEPGRWSPCEGATSPVTYYADEDDDGYGDPSDSMSSCDDVPAYVTNDDDCNDACRDCNPEGTEVCGGLDEDCDTDIDEDAGPTWYIDADGDMHGAIDGATMRACTRPPGYVADEDDCDDTCVRCYEGYPLELCGDGDDNNCSGSTDETACCDYVDLPGTGTYLFCRATEAWNMARDRCRDYGGELAAFETSAERTAVWGVAAIRDYNAGETGSVGHIWLGGSDGGTEGTWVWAGGGTISTCTFSGSWSCVCASYCGWEPGQPNAGSASNNEDCTTVNPTWVGTIGDWPCGNRQAFVCEL
jgi:hypothetical protein